MKAVIFSDHHGEMVLTDEPVAGPAVTCMGRVMAPEELDGRVLVRFMGYTAGPEDSIPVPGSDEGPGAGLLVEMWIRGDFAWDAAFRPVPPEALDLAERFLHRVTKWNP